MIIPIRCFTCNKPISAKYQAYLERKKDLEQSAPELTTEDINQGNVKKTPYGVLLDELNIERYCCRRMFLGQVDIIDII